MPRIKELVAFLEEGGLEKYCKEDYFPKEIVDKVMVLLDRDGDECHSKDGVEDQEGSEEEDGE